MIGFPLLAIDFKIRISVPVYYEDAHGEDQQKLGNHSLLLPHEVVGAFFSFKHANLMERLIGDLGDSQLHVPPNSSPNRNNNGTRHSQA